LYAVQTRDNPTNGAMGCRIKTLLVSNINALFFWGRRGVSSWDLWVLGMGDLFPPALLTIYLTMLAFQGHDRTVCTILLGLCIFGSGSAASFQAKNPIKISECQTISSTRLFGRGVVQAEDNADFPLTSTMKSSEIHGSATTKPLVGRRSYLAAVGAAAVGTTATTFAPRAAVAEIGSDSQWPLWPALPVAPYSRRRTIREEVVPGKVWIFDQLIGIYYVHVPIRMTVVRAADDSGGLVVYALVAPTKECLSLLKELINVHGPIKAIILPSVAVEHKVLAGPFARKYPDAAFYVTDQQYSFPVSLPALFLGLPSWTKPLPSSSKVDNILGSDFDWEVLTVKPGPGSNFQDVAVWHKSSKTLMVCDALFATTMEPPAILTQEPEYTRALLFHARDSKDEIITDTPEARRKGWRRIVLLFNFFFPGAGTADLGLRPILQALQTPNNLYGWGGWKPFSWENEEAELLDFNTFSAYGKPTILPIIQIILARGPEAVTQWVNAIAKWDFHRVIPAHLDAPLEIGPEQFAETFDFVKRGKNEVRFCDEDVAFLRRAEEGILSFSVYPSSLGALRGGKGPCGL
jgi:hypothetical protein